MENVVVQSIFRENQYLLKRHLVLSTSVLEELRKSGVVTGVLCRKMMREPNYKQIQMLLNEMEYKGLPSLRKFLEVLRRTGHGWLAEAMLDTDVNAANKRRFARDDISHRDGFEAQPPAPRQLPSIGPLLGPRQSMTAGVMAPYPSGGVMASAYPSEGPDDGLSLASLLRAREPANDENAPRGVINAREFLQGQFPQIAGPYPARVGGLIPFPRAREDIPFTLYGLNQQFSEQDQKHQHAMSVLKQEEVAIRQLMEQNARDQGQVHRKQAAVQDITRRLRDIYVRANDVYEPSPHPNIGRYRLHQLNQIPWSIAD